MLLGWFRPEREHYTLATRRAAVLRHHWPGNGARLAQPIALAYLSAVIVVWPLLARRGNSGCRNVHLHVPPSRLPTLELARSNSRLQDPRRETAM